MTPATLDAERVAASVPIRNRRVTVERSADGATVSIEVELQRSGWQAWLRRFIRDRDRRRYELDRLGTEVYDSIDDRKSFLTLVDEFAARHKLTYFESRGLLMQYLQALMRRGIVAIGVQT